MCSAVRRRLSPKLWRSNIDAAFGSVEETARIVSQIARAEMENRIKETRGDLFADRTSTATVRANQFRLWFSSMAYVLICALRRIGLAHTSFPNAACGAMRLKLLKLGALAKISARRVKIAFSSCRPWAQDWRFAAGEARARPWLSGARGVAVTP